MKKSEELQYLHKKCELIIDFIERKSPLGSSMKDYKSALELAYNKKNLRGIRIASRDLIAWTNGFPPQYIAELEDILTTHLQKDDKSSIEVSVEKILLNKVIKNADEYRLIQECLSDVSKENPFIDKADLMNSLLELFEKNLNSH